MNDDDFATLGLLDDDEIEIDHAALLLSALDHPDADLEPRLALLDAIDARLADVGAAAREPGEQADALAAVLAGEFGFAGDAETYDAPQNADFLSVLERRRGLPVSLSILYVAVARRMGWTAHALNTPGHVLVRIGEAPGAVIDPFGDGLRAETLLPLLGSAPGNGHGAGAQPAEALTNRGVLIRLLLNLATRAERGGDPLRALTLYDRMTTVAPDNPDGWWELARLQLSLGDVEAARGSLAATLEVTRDPERRRLVAATLGAIATE